MSARAAQRGVGHARDLLAPTVLGDLVCPGPQAEIQARAAHLRDESELLKRLHQAKRLVLIELGCRIVREPETTNTGDQYSG